MVGARAWHLLEAHLVVNSTSSTVAVNLDGKPVSGLSFTDDFGTTPVGRIQFGDKTLAKTDAEALVKTLQGVKIVSFAELAQ